MASARVSAQRTFLEDVGGKDSRRKLSRFLVPPALLVAFACPARAEKLVVVPTLSLAETYTDNVSLIEDASKQSDWVTQVIPGISITGTGARLKLKLNYAPEYLRYARRQDRNQVFQRGNAFAYAELAKQLLFIEAGSRVDQYNVTLQDPLSTSNINTTGNRATARTSYVSPYLVGDFGSAVRGEARFTHSVLNSDSTTELSDNTADRVNLQLASGPAYKLLTWDIGYKRETIKYETQEKALTEVITANARQKITPTVGLLAQAGYERYELGIPGSVPQSSIERSNWSAGLEWTPIPRTSLAATAGKRLDEDAYNIKFRHYTRLTTWSAIYSEDVSASRSEFFLPDTSNTAGALDQLFLSRYPDPVERQKAVDEFIARIGLPPNLNAPTNFFSDQLFVVKRWQASCAFLGVRNVLLANAFSETRELLFSGMIQPSTSDFAASASIGLVGASLVWNWRMTARTAWNLGAGNTRNKFTDIDRVDELTYIRMGFTRQFQPGVTGSLNYRRQQYDSTKAASGFKENAAIASLYVKF